jgi:FkbM family methyltransferase
LQSSPSRLGRAEKKGQHCDVQQTLIFDVGCHIGEDADFYLQKGFTVVAVEANPTLCALLKSRFGKEIDAGRFTLVEKAIAESSGEVDFFVNLNNSIWGTIRPNMAARNMAEVERITVPSVAFSSVIRQFGVPYYLKIDIEGADLLCLKDLLSFAERPRFLSLEIDHRSLLNKELALLRRLGYTKFQIIDQRQVPEQRPPWPAREGQFANYQLTPGMSGLFGAELPGPWLSASGVRLHQLKLLIHNRARGLCRRVPALRRLSTGGSWYDLHCAYAG